MIHGVIASVWDMMIKRMRERMEMRENGRLLVEIF